ncbi:MAG: hypothetical protein ACO1N9_01510 [Flavobacterium sp.]
MKRIYTLLLLLAPVLLATSCQEDDAVLNTTAVVAEPQQQPEEPQEQEQPQNPTGDSWSLINVSGSIAGVSHNFPVGQITWTFNENATIDVVNNNPDQNLEDFLDSGNFTYGFIPSEMPTNTCSEDLFVWCFVLGCQNIDGDTMTITQQFADGYTLTFRKN